MSRQILFQHDSGECFFANEQFSHVQGGSKVFTRVSDAGRTLSMHFCPDCGTTVFWRVDGAPDRVAVAVGCFADPHFPAPIRNVWAKNRHHWVEFPKIMKLFDEAP